MTDALRWLVNLLNRLACWFLGHWPVKHIHDADWHWTEVNDEEATVWADVTKATTMCRRCGKVLE